MRTHKIAAYKVVNGHGEYATGGFNRFSSLGKTWASKAALNCAFSHWKAHRKYCNPATGKWDWLKDANGRYIQYDAPLPEDWVVIELTPSGLKEIPARQFYGK